MAKVGRLKSRKPNGLPSVLRLGFGGGNINDLTPCFRFCIRLRGW